MLSRLLSWTAVVVTAFALWAGAVVLNPAPLAAATCGGPGDEVCRTVQSCVGWGLFRVCTTTYDYWQEDDDDDDDDEEELEP